MRFYEIDARIEELLDVLVDADGVINEEAEKELAELELAAEQKTEGILLAIKGMAAEARAIREEETALADRRHAIERKAESLKDFIQHRLAGEKFATPRVAVSYRKTTSVEIQDGSWLWWPGELDEAVSYTPKINKNMVKDALKKGIEVKGARLVEGVSMSIK